MNTDSLLLNPVSIWCPALEIYGLEIQIICPFFLLFCFGETEEIRNFFFSKLMPRGNHITLKRD